MEELQASLPGLSLVFVWTVAATVFIIQKLKMLVARSKKRWTQKIPSWLWLVASVAFPLAVIAVMTQGWAQNIVNSVLPDSLKITAGVKDLAPLSFSATLGANGSYAVAKKLGLTGNYKPGGPNDETPKEETVAEPAPTEPPAEPLSAPPVMPEVVEESARLFVEATPPASTPYYVYVEDGAGGRLIPVKPK
jgi:hypothetical protein